jgi:MFS superfamily sulfate permease-like transporter
LLDFNLKEVRNEIMELAERHGPSLRFAVGSLAVTPWIDLSATDTLYGLRKDFAANNVIFAISEAHNNAKDTFRSAGVVDEVGGQNLERTTAQVIEEWEKHHSKIEKSPSSFAMAFRELGIFSSSLWR